MLMNDRFNAAVLWIWSAVSGDNHLAVSDIARLSTVASAPIMLVYITGLALPAGHYFVQCILLTLLSLFAGAAVVAFWPALALLPLVAYFMEKSLAQTFYHQVR